MRWSLFGPVRLLSRCSLILCTNHIKHLFDLYMRVCEGMCVQLDMFEMTIECIRRLVVVVCFNIAPLHVLVE